MNDDIRISRSELPDPEQIEGFWKMQPEGVQLDAKHLYDTALYYLACAIKAKGQGN